jgi:hypothetical protein
MSALEGLKVPNVDQRLSPADDTMKFQFAYSKYCEAEIFSGLVVVFGYHPQDKR